MESAVQYLDTYYGSARQGAVHSFLKMADTQGNSDAWIP